MSKLLIHLYSTIPYKELLCVHNNLLQCDIWKQFLSYA